MIATVLQGKNLSEILDILDSGEVEMAEIRLDRCPLDDGEIRELFSVTDIPLIATCRISECRAGEAEARKKYLAAIEAGAKYADLEVEASAFTGRDIRRACNRCGTLLVRSWHNFRETPSDAVLRSVLDKCAGFGADIIKIVTTAESDEDIARVMGLYDDAAPGTLIAFAMGEKGRESRMDALKNGAPYTYASLSEDDSAAPGQWTTAEMKAALYGDFRFVGKDSDPVTMPSSKSFAQRAIIAAALASGTSHLSGYSPCGDNESAIAAAKALGAKVIREDDVLTIEGAGLDEGKLEIKEIHAGESGFLARLLIPLAGVLSNSPVRITGEKTLLKRPLAYAHDIMAAYGVRLFQEGNPPVRREDAILPLEVHGPILPGKAEVDGRGGSQLISGLLAALPFAERKSVLYVENPRSIPYMFITIDVLKNFGIEIGSEMEGGEDFLQSQDWTLATGVNFYIKGRQHYFAADFRIEGDWSSAANFLVAGAVFGEAMLTGLDTASLQADISIMDILMDAGASISQLEGNTPSTGPLCVRRAPLAAFETDLNNCPDLFPAVAVLAAFSEGESRINGTDRLAHKETDRAAAIVEMLTGLGVEAHIEDGQMYIRGESLSHRLATGNLLRGGRFSSHGDHRMVMALRVASLGASSPVEIDDENCVGKSFPKFTETFEKFTKSL